MKVAATLLTLALAGAAVAQSPSLPTCAQGCANKALTGGIGNCGSNPACICADKDFLSNIACCLAGVCQPPDQTSAVSFAASFCSAAGVTDLPTAVSCSTTAAAASATTTSSSAGAKTTGASSSGSAASSSSAGSASAGSSAASQTSAASTAAASASTSHSSNLGPRPTAAAGLGAIGGIMAAVALL